jgi:hypothetical protein
MTEKTEAKKELQRLLANLRADLKDVEKFAIDNQLEFDFMGMKYFLKDPNGGDRIAKKGIFVSEAEWNSSGWGCNGGDTYEAYSEWESKYFPYEE